MGIVARQSIYNIASIGLAFAIGAVNTLFLYPGILGVSFYAIIVALLASSNILQPIFSFGMQHAVIKFYSAAENQDEKDKILFFSLLLPLCIILPSGLLFTSFYDEVAAYMATENAAMRDYVFLIFAIAVCTSYFEIFYSWARVQKKSVFGNFLKEVYQRVMIFVLLLLYFFKIIGLQGFIYGLIVGYFLRLAVMFFHSISLYRPRFVGWIPKAFKQLLAFSSLIFLSGFGASLILDIDKTMLIKLVEGKYVAYYTVAVFIASVIDMPNRAMVQIINPLIAEALNKQDKERLYTLLYKSSLHMLMASGLLFVLINSNGEDLYAFIAQLNGKPGFDVALPVVFILSLTKLFSALMGCVNNIITNSQYYKYVPVFTLGSAVSVVLLNLYFIQHYGFFGAAYATFAVISVFNALKLFFVYRAFGIHPFSKPIFLLLILIIGLTIGVSFIPFTGSPFLNLVLRSLLILIVFGGLVLGLRLSEDVAALVGKWLKKVKA